MGLWTVAYLYLLSDGNGVHWSCHGRWQPGNKHLSLETVLRGKWFEHTVGTSLRLCSQGSCSRCVMICIFLILAFSITPSWSSTTLMSPWWWHPRRSAVSCHSWCNVWAADGVWSAFSLIWWILVTQRWSPSLWNPQTCSLLPKPVYQMPRSFTPSSMSMGERQKMKKIVSSM